jgi:hypothetical protein
VFTVQVIQIVCQSDEELQQIPYIYTIKSSFSVTKDVIHLFFFHFYP